MMEEKALFLLWLCLLAAVAIAGTVKKRQKKKRQREFVERQKEKGDEGERATEALLNQVRGFKRVLRQVYVPREDTGTSELDLVMIHEKGIFVIENKYYKGRIYGDEKELYWMQVFKRGEKRPFYNPVKQNQTHIRNLKRFLEDKIPWDIPYVSVVVFNGSGKLRRALVDPNTAIVVSGKKVKRRLKRYMRRMRRVLTKGQIDEISHFLSRRARGSKRVRRQHEKQF